MSTNQDFNLVSTTTPTDKGGQYLQIRNKHTHGNLNNPHTYDSLNRYAYCEGNPVSLVDPFGLSPEST